MDLLAPFGEHAGFIAAAYAIAVMVIAGLIVWVRLNGAHQLRQLEDLERRGIRRQAASADDMGDRRT